MQVRIAQVDRGVIRVIGLEDVSVVVGHPSEGDRGGLIVAGLVREKGLVIELGDPVDRPAAVAALLVEHMLVGGPEDLVWIVGREQRSVEVQPGRRVVAEDLDRLTDDPIVGPVGVAQVATVGPAECRSDGTRQEHDGEDQRGERTTARSRHDGRLRTDLWVVPIIPYSDRPVIPRVVPSTGRRCDYLRRAPR